MYRGIKIRLKPTVEQEELIWKHINYSRFIWNYMLELQQTRHTNGERYLATFDMIKLLTPLKQQPEYKWLNDVSVSTLQRTCQDLHIAYQKFFNKTTRHPKFKSKKKSKPKCPLCDLMGKTYFKDGFVHLQKIGDVKYQTNRVLPKGKKVKLINPRLSLQNNKWIMTFSIEYESQIFEHKGKMGIDLGIKELAVVSYENQCIIFHNINKTNNRIKRMEHKIKYLHIKVLKKYRINGNYDKTKNIIKVENKLKESYYHLSKIRENYVHQVTHYLVTLLPEQIVMEKLNLLWIYKNKYLAKAISGQYLYAFIRMMQYKSEWYGIKFIQADRFFPSSKMCSNCNHIKKDLKLDDRIYKCEHCGLTIDRDYNAAINLKNYNY